MPRNNCRKDNNHNEIAEVFIEAGWEVIDTSKLRFGFPDLIVTPPGSTCPILIEVKSEKGTLSKAERDFHKAYRGRLFIVRNTAQAQAVIDKEKNASND